MTFTRAESSNYHSYLLRMWRDGPEQAWRASMHCSATGTLHHFAGMAHLLAFLQGLTDATIEVVEVDTPAEEGSQPSD